MARTKDLDLATRFVGPLAGPHDGRGTVLALGGTSIGRAISMEHEVTRASSREEIGEGRRPPAQPAAPKKVVTASAGTWDVVLFAAVLVAGFIIAKKIGIKVTK